jgi:hypothetical protein
VCEVGLCACEGTLVCVPGCTSSAGCEIGQTCDVPTARCVATACDAADGVCPPDHDCVGARCQRRACDEPGDCDGACVEGMCEESYGQCRPPAA